MNTETTILQLTERIEKLEMNFANLLNSLSFKDQSGSSLKEQFERMDEYKQSKEFSDGIEALLLKLSPPVSE